MSKMQAVSSGSMTQIMQGASPDSPEETTTVGEMVPTQGWVEGLFGGGGAQPRRSEPPREPRSIGEKGEQEGERGQRRMSTLGTYRTVCVRLCDGFFWPISHATTRNRFVRDAKQCEQACPTPSRMFVHRTSDMEPASMTDLDGRPYERLENAFRYQREYVADCSCRGNPWDEEALARHRAYAEAAQAEKEKSVAAAEKPRSEQQASRRERAAGRSQRWARSGWRDRAGNED